MTYFNYFTEIEDAFVRRRGKHLLLSPLDWALIESWKERNVPLHVALRGIEKAFDSWESRPRKRSVKTLLYCQEEVEAQYAEWVAAHVGENIGPAVSASDEALPFAREEILEHLRRGRLQLVAIANARNEEELAETLQRTIAVLEELEKDLVSGALVDAQKLETSLTGLERMLSEAIMSALPLATLEAIKQQTKDQLKPYRRQMEKAAYEQTFANLLLKRLRETFAIPRLSLFYL